MRTFRRVFSGLLIATLATACGHSRAPTRVSAVVQREDEFAIRQALSDWVTAYNRRDYAAARDIWAPGVQGWFPQDPHFSNAAAAETAGVARSEAPEKTEYSTYDLTIEEVLVSGDLAVVRDTWRETRHFDGDRARATRLIRSFEVWQRRSGNEWKISRWISSPEPWQRSVD